MEKGESKKNEEGRNEEAGRGKEIKGDNVKNKLTCKNVHFFANFIHGWKNISFFRVR